MSEGVSAAEDVRGVVLRLVRPRHFVFSECSVDPSPEARARMEQYFGAVPPAGEHTVSKAIAVGRTDERSKTFLVPFAVQQKGLGCRAETRPGGRTETLRKHRPP
jgi:hypothetical protein